MAIVQISKIQQRAGNLVDLPQLDNAEFGWAADENRLFIGRTGNSYADENIEVLTSYSNISFSQINGSDGGNFNVVAAQNGQILTYVSSTDTWENYTGLNSQLNGSKLKLGDVANISMLGGAIAYVLQTDGLGNLSWTPKGTLYTSIKALSNANPIVMTVANTTPYVNGTSVTITGVAGTNVNTIVNGQSFYLTLANDYPTSGNVKLYTDTGRTVGANGATMTATANTGIATSVISSGGGGTGLAAGANTSVQFNDQNLPNGVAGFTFDKNTTTLTVATGNIISGNVNANTSITAPSLVSNIAIGTAPLTVTSTTLVPNLYVARANVADYGVVTTQTTGTFYPVFVNGSSTANYAHASNSNLSFNVATGNLSTTILNATGNITGANLIGPLASGNSNVSITANANITFYVAGNTTARFTATTTGIVANGTANISGNITSANANLGNLATANYFAGTLTTAAQPNITSTGSLTFAANGNITMSGGSSQLAGGNLVSASYLTGTLTTAAQPNITSLGTLTGLTSNGVVNFTNASNVSLGAIGNVKITGGSNTQVLQTDGAGNLVWANSAGGYYLHTQASGNTVWNVVHNLNNKYVSVEPIDNTGNSYTGRYDYPIVNYTNANALTLTFSSAVNGWAAVVGGGYTNATTVTPTPSGFDTYVQYNNAGNLGANSAFTFTVASGRLNATLFAGSGANLTSIPGANVTGAVPYATTANAVAGANVSGAVAYATTANAVAGANVSGQVANALVAGTVYTAAQGNITSVGTLTGLTLANAAIISVGSNSNVGTFTGNFSLSAGSRLNATYADLAEYYEADKLYEPGTILEFGGDKEVTLAEALTPRVAGVVSTNPAYVMNSTCEGEHIVALALQGRVPCKVRGTIHKGDMLVSAGGGFARPSTIPLMGTVIGKALENFEGEGIIEVAVGRL